MITKFKIFENTSQSELPLNKLINDICFTIYKGKKRNGNINYKQLKVKEIHDDNKIYIDSDKLKNIYNHVRLVMSNKDEIDAKYNQKFELDTMVENKVSIEINDNLLYEIDYKGFNKDSFINKIVDVYEKYLKSKNWKIK